jgi:hypothetical protein
MLDQNKNKTAGKKSVDHHSYVASETPITTRAMFRWVSDFGVSHGNA